MEQIVRSRPRVPAVSGGSGVSSARLDHHLAVLGGPVVPQRDSADATLLMRELTAHDHAPTSAQNRGARVSLFAPLRRLRRSLFGGRG